MKINLANQDFGSLTENVPRLKVSNMYIIDNPESISGISYVARPSLSLLTTIPNEVVRGIWYQSQDGATTIYIVAGQNLYTYDAVNNVYTLVGPLPGSTYCTFSSTIYYIAIESDGLLYVYDGATITNIPIPDGQLIGSVTSLDNYLIVGILNTGTFYFVRPGSTTIDGLDFETAERNPDDIVTMTAIGDEVWAIGQETIEIFTDTGDQTAPFLRTAGRVYRTGCADKNSIVQTVSNVQTTNINGTLASPSALPCLIWVTPSKEVVLAQGTPSKISNESIEELLKSSTTYTAWTFRTNKHDFYVLNTDTVTVVYDITARLWYRWNSYQQNTWKALSGIQINDEVFAINGSDGQIYELTFKPVDLTSDYLVCEIGGFIGNTSNSGIPCNSVTLFLNYGFTSSYTTLPVIEMRYSDDGGATFSNYLQGFVGAKGGYNASVRFRSLGNFSRPGRFFEFRFSEVQTFRLDGAITNDSQQ